MTAPAMLNPRGVFVCDDPSAAAWYASGWAEPAEAAS